MNRGAAEARFAEGQLHPSREQRALLRQILDHIDDLDRRVAVLDGMVEQYMAECAQALDAIDEIPGIAQRSAQVILAEIGLDMERFSSAAHLCFWAGVSPGTIRVRGNGSTAG